MSRGWRGSLHDRWAYLRLSIVGPLLASPPAARGELRAGLEALARHRWVHPVTGEPVSFAVPTIERWYYEAKRGGDDLVRALRKKVRKDAGAHPSLTPAVRELLRTQYDAHRSWSYQLHADNLAVECEEQTELSCPSYTTVRRYMKKSGLFKQRRLSSVDTAGAERARERLERKEVRSYEATHVHGLWHTDFHVGKRSVLTRTGERVKPKLLGVLDDLSRVACHLQWYLDEETESFVHGLTQAKQKRGLPGMLMTDGGSAMTAGETRAGLCDLSIVHWETLPYSPYQNGKQETFWTQVEGRLMAMLEGVPELTLAELNEATQAWAELEYNRDVHKEIGMAPVARMLAGPTVARACPSADELRRAFRLREHRTQRRSDGTVSIEGVRFEVPNRLRHLERLAVRYARWDLSTVDVVDERAGTVIATMYPLDKTKNADGQRRALDRIETPATAAPKPVGMAPLLRKLVTEYRETGLPPAYVPKHDLASSDDKEVDDDE